MTGTRAADRKAAKTVERNRKEVSELTAGRKVKVGKLPSVKTRTISFSSAEASDKHQAKFGLEFSHNIFSVLDLRI